MHTNFRHYYINEMFPWQGQQEEENGISEGYRKAQSRFADQPQT